MRAASTTLASDRSHLIEWLRLPGDVIFILFGAVPLVIASIKAYLGVRAVDRQGAGAVLRMSPNTQP